MAPVRRLRQWKIGKLSLPDRLEVKGVVGPTSHGGPSGYPSTQTCFHCRKREVRSAMPSQRAVCLTFFSWALRVAAVAAFNSSDWPRSAGISTARSSRWCRMSFTVVPADQGMIFQSSWARNEGLRVVRAAPTY